ncbi:MAG: M23 family metallopeptidase [Nonlabens sp.]|uniref:M23 family metallopeptidase n=1 Tax=Nonlabens sp. TaxID=1888209 RepID=UPI00321B56FE
MSIAIISISSCEKDEVFQEEPAAVAHHKMKASVSSLAKIKTTDSKLYNYLSERALTSLKSGNTGSGAILDTSYIQVLEGTDYKNYIFRVATDSTNAVDVLKNYMLVVLKDSIQQQFMVTYPYVNQVVDTTNVLIEPVFGTDILNQFTLKCGGSSFQSVWIPGSTVSYPCASGRHVFSQGTACDYWEKPGEARVVYTAGYFVTQYVEQQPCETIGTGDTGNGGGGANVNNPNPPPPDDPNDEDENEQDMEIGITPNEERDPDPDCELECEENEVLELDKCECIPENCEYKTGYLHESAFTNNSAEEGKNTTSSQDNFRDEDGAIIEETNCDSGKIDSGSEVNVTGAVESRSYTMPNGTTAMSNYYPIEYLDCPKGNRPGNPDYDSTKPCSDCTHGDPVPNPEIQGQTTACGTKGGMYGMTRGAAGTAPCNYINHGGMDIKNDFGDSVYAMFDGTATIHYESGGAGYYVIITSTVGDDTIKSYYFYLQQSNRISGAVNAGDVIGSQGNSGNLQAGIDEGSTESHVHIKIRENGTVVDPIDYFKTTFNETTGAVTSSGCN